MGAGSSAARADGERGVAVGLDLDFSEAYNRIVDTWYPVFAAASQLSMPIAACAYPINMGEHVIASIRDDVVPEDHYLRWQMAMDADDSASGEGGYHLYCNWQGRGWEHGGGRYCFIENAVGWVDWYGGDGRHRLDVEVAFGRPEFVDGVAAMVVDFHVCETGLDGAIARDTRRPFRIHADGRREPLF